MKKAVISSVQLTTVVSLIVSLLTCAAWGQSNSAVTVDNAQITTVQANSFNVSQTSLDKNIRSIFQDSKGNYWFGTNAAGVYRYDKKTLAQFTVQDGLADNQILSIQEDDSGIIWFGTGAFGVSKFDGKKITSYTISGSIVPGDAGTGKLAAGDLWFYGGAGAFRYNKPGLNNLSLASADTDAASQNTNPYQLSRYGVYCILKDSKGAVWFGTQAEGVCRYDGRSLTWFKEKGLAGPAVLGLFEDSKGNLWFGNNGAGLFCYNGKTLSNFTEENGLGNADFRASGTPGLGTLARVYCINEDSSGNIWMGTVDAGVWKYEGSRLTNYTTYDGLTSNAVNTIYKDKSGTLWFGTDANGICTFNGKTFTEFVIK